MKKRLKGLIVFGVFFVPNILWAKAEFKVSLGWNPAFDVFDNSTNSTTTSYGFGSKSVNADFLFYFWRLGLGARTGTLSSYNNASEIYSTENKVALNYGRTMGVVAFRVIDSQITASQPAAEGRKPAGGGMGPSNLVADLIFAKQVNGEATIGFSEGGTPKVFKTSDIDDFSVSGFVASMNSNVGVFWGLEFGNQWITLKNLSSDVGTLYGEDLKLNGVFFLLHFGIGI